MKQLKSALTSILLLIGFSLGALAAPDFPQLRGKVLDQDGLPVPGVAVILQGTNQATITDANGYYFLDVPKVGAMVEFSCLGFKTQTLAVPKSFSLDVFLEMDTLEMDEAVVVGMGKQRKISVLGAINAIDNKDITLPTRNLTNALAGKVAGAVIVQRTGEPGLDNAEFWIRGISSLNSSSPLVLVDGVEREMSSLSIDEIESISVLKDASATAVYGVRAANGVVIVTTRRGVAQKPVIDIKFEGGISNLTKMPQLLDGPNYMALCNEAAGYTMYSQDAIDICTAGTDPYMYPNVNWFDEIFTKFSSNTQESVSIRGGGERARYYVTVAYLNDNGNFKNNPKTDYSSNIHVSRYNFRSNVDITLTKSTTFSLELGANITDSHQPAPTNDAIAYYSVATQLFGYCYEHDPISAPVVVPIGYNDVGEMEWGWGSSLSGAKLNPAERLLGSGYNQSTTTNIMSQMILKQDLGMLTPGLSAQLSFSYDVSNASLQSRHKMSWYYAINGTNDDGGYVLSTVREGDTYLAYGKNFSSSKSNELKAQINYDRAFAEKHRVGAMLMYYQRSYVNPIAGSSTAALPYRKQGIALRATYSYDDRYFAEFNAGFNGSENFQKGHRMGLFPAGAVGYLISSEPWWKVKAINHLKLRASIGLVGSDNSSRFAYLSTWSSGNGGHRFGNGVYNTGLGEDEVGVSDLTWEKGLKKDVGLEIKMFKSKFSLDIDYFHDYRYDILIRRSSIPAVAGLNKMPYANMGRMTNQGVEVTAEYNGKIGKDFGYRIYGNCSWAHNNIDFKDEAQTDPWRMETNHRYGQRFGYVAVGLFDSQEDIDNSPDQSKLGGQIRVGDVKYLDFAGGGVNGDEPDGIIDEHDQTAIGYSSIPELNYGFGFQITYRGFDFGAFFRGQAMVSYALDGTFFPFYQGVGQYNLFAKAMDRAQVGVDEFGAEYLVNPDAFYPRLSSARNTNNTVQSTRTIYDGSLIRLSDLEVGYSFRADWLSKIKCSSARIYMVGTNLLTFSKWKMWDAETGSADGSKYPLVRKINFGLRLTF